MVLGWFNDGENTKKDESEVAKSEFESACAETHEDKKSRANRIKIGLRCRAVIDTLFIEGAKEFEKFHKEKLEALWEEKTPPKEPKPNNYQIIKSSQGDVVGYIPMEYAQSVYDIASEFQKKDISKEHAINLTQIVADNICNMLSLETSFNVLDFLRDEQKDKKD
ncbi:hypothetical protein N9V13_00605 [Betaproteobacteria bacterium]|nr:hypothetical protein [Betaproteobacteria bacterium]